MSWWKLKQWLNPEENYESTIEDFGVYETEVKEEIISEFYTDDIVNDPNYFDQGYISSFPSYHNYIGT